MELPSVCTRCGYIRTDEDKDKPVTLIHDTQRGEDVYLCPTCTQKLYQIMLQFVKQTDKI